MKFNIFFILASVVISIVVSILIVRNERFLDHLLIHRLTTIRTSAAAIGFMIVKVRSRISAALKLGRRIRGAPLELERINRAARRLQTRVRIRAAVIDRNLPRNGEHDGRCVAKLSIRHSFSIRSQCCARVAAFRVRI